MFLINFTPDETQFAEVNVPYNTNEEDVENAGYAPCGKCKL